MRIVVWGINYAPELTGIGPHNAALCEYLAKRGHDVEMLTSFRYYPEWRKAVADRGCVNRTEQINGVTVRRCWHYVPRHVTNWKRILHELSFSVVSTFRFLAMRRPDLIMVVSPPLLLGVAGWLGGILKRAPFMFHAQDLQPDGALELGMLQPGYFVGILLKVEAFVYRKAQKVSGISEGMLREFTRKGVPASKQILFPNTIVVPKPGDIPARGLFRAKHGLSHGDFIAAHSGNLGMKHGLQTLLEASTLVKNDRLRIVICGEGAVRDSLREMIARDGLRNILLLPLQPEAEYRELLADIDVALVTQQKGSGRSFFPSKLLSALAFAKPVLAVGDEDGELSRDLSAGGFGVMVPAGDPGALARELDLLADRRIDLAAFGSAGREWVERFERARVFDEFAAAILP